MVSSCWNIYVSFLDNCDYFLILVGGLDSIVSSFGARDDCFIGESMFLSGVSINDLMDLVLTTLS